MKPAHWVKILGIAALLIASVALAAEVEDNVCPDGTWRYKITVNVETPEGLKTGSAVREVSVELQPRPGYKPHPCYAVKKSKGEAVVVDLGKRGVLFLLTSYDDYMSVFHAFPGPPGLTPDGVRYYRSLKNVKANLTVANPYYPALVTFTDLNDPKTVQSVYEIGCRKDWSVCPQEDRYVKADRFEEAFGKGVRLKDVVIEITDEPVTWGVEKYLSWLLSLKGGYLHGGFTGRDAPLGLDGGNFKTGER